MKTKKILHLTLVAAICFFLFPVLGYAHFGVNLISNPSAENPLPFGGGISGWTEVGRPTWGYRKEDPSAYDGTYYFFAGSGRSGELRQDIDVSEFNSTISAKIQSFTFIGYACSYPELPGDTAQFIIEYRDSSNTNLLSSYISAAVESTTWEKQANTMTAPVGTGWIRIRLISTRNFGETNDGYFDALSLKANSAAPTVSTDPFEYYHGDDVYLKGTIAPNGLSTTWYFKYGSLSAYLDQTLSGTSTLSGNDPVGVQLPLNNLKTGTTYFFKLYGTNSLGTSSGSTRSVTISPPAIGEILTADANPTRALSVDYTVMFSEEVNGVDISDFYLDYNGTLSDGVVAQVNGSGSEYTVTVTNYSGRGTMTLKVSNNYSIKDYQGYSLASGTPESSEQYYNVDTNALQVDKVDQTLGLIGQELPNVIYGTGLSGETKARLVLDSANEDTQLGSLNVLGHVTCNFKISEGGLMYVGRTSYEVQPSETYLSVYDVSTSDVPVKRGEVVTPIISSSQLELVGTRVVITSIDSLDIIDVSNPDLPQKRGSLSLSGLYPEYYLDGLITGAMKIQDDSVFLVFRNSSTHDGMLVRVDISDANNPVEVAAYSFQGRIKQFELIGQACFVRTEFFDAGTSMTTSVFYQFDISNPALFGYVAEKTLSESVESFCIAGNKAILELSDRLHILLLDQPITILLNKDNILHTWGALEVDIYQSMRNFETSIPGNIPLDMKSLTFYNNQLYFLEWMTGLWVMDLEGTKAYSVSANLPKARGSNSLFIHDQYAYVNRPSSFQVVDLSGSVAPLNHLGFVYAPGLIYDQIEFNEKRAFFKKYGEIIWFDISKFASAAQDEAMNIVPLPGLYWESMDISGNRIYIRYQNGQDTHVYDITDPLHPQFIDLLDISPLKVINGKAFSWNAGEMTIYADIENTENPDFQYFFPTTRLLDVAVDAGRNLAFCLTEDKVIMINLTTYSKIGEIDYTPNGTASIAMSNDSNAIYILDKDSLDLINLIIWDVLGIFEMSNPGPFTQSCTVSYNTMCQSDEALYVAACSGFQVYDITTSWNPVLVNETPGFGGGECLVQGDELVLNGYNQAKTYDISDPFYPLHSGSVTKLMTLGSGGSADFLQVGPFLYFLAWEALEIQPSPIKPSSYVPLGNDQLQVTFPPHDLPGNYNLFVYNNVIPLGEAAGNELAKLVGAVTYTDNDDLLTTRAIIVAGSNSSDFQNDFVWSETKAYADQAYANLRYQGYAREDILYLSADSALECGPGIESTTEEGVDCRATLNGLQYAITTWAKNNSASKDLLLYMVDHGGPGTFHVNATEILNAGDLDSWLDDLQTTMPISDSAQDYKVLLLYDACKSGSFIKFMSPPAGKTRISMVSSSANQPAYFLNPDHSFSAHFWSTLSGKSGDQAKPSEAFQRASSEMSGYQTALLNANGNGVANEEEDYAALETLEGTIYALRRQYFSAEAQKPVIATVTADRSFGGETTATLTAADVADPDGDNIVRVWAEITSPDFDPAADETVTSIPSIDLVGPNADGIYEGIYAGFTVKGTYLIFYYAEDEKGIYSLPRSSVVVQTSGAASSQPDAYEEDDTLADARVIVVNNPTPQGHTFHETGDADWVKFYALAGKTYKIKTSNLSIINDTRIALYNAGGTEPAIVSVNAGGFGAEEYLVWTCPPDESGIYTVKISNAGSHYGANVRYELMVFEPTADFFTQGMIEGYVEEAVGAVPIINALVGTTDGQAAGLTQRTPDGYYLMMVEGGKSYTVQASAPGFNSVTLGGVNVAIMESTAADFYLPPENTPPVISGTPAATVNEDSLYSFTPIVDDPDDTVTFSIAGRPIWASFNNTSGQLSGTPNNGHVGSYNNITITVTDSQNASDSLGPFSITVNNTNDAPTIISGPPLPSVNEDSLYSYTAIAQDADAGDSVTLSITGRPIWAVFNPGTGILSGTPDNGDVATYVDIVITATDQSGATASVGPFSITVANVNDSPTANAGNDFDANEKSVVTLSGSATDPDAGDTPALLWEQIGGGTSVVINYPATATAYFTAPEVGTGGEVLTFQLTATDGDLETHVDTCTVTINWVAEATAGPDQSIDERDTTTLGAVGDPDGPISTVVWAQVSGYPAELADGNTLAPTVTAPNVSEGASEVLEFEVTIIYFEGQSATDSCFITVNDLEEDLDHDNDIDGSDVAEFGSQLDQGSNAVTIDQFSEEFGK